MRTEDDRLADELRALGRSLMVPENDESLVADVMARVEHEPAPASARPARAVRRWWVWLTSRRKPVAATLAGVLIALALTPPVRAAVADWFGFGGVVVHETPAPASSAPPPPPARSELSVDEAARLVDFRPVIPAELGRPDGVEVSDDRRVLSLSWLETADGPIRLDQFDGGLAPVFHKLAARFTVIDVDRVPHLWLPEPHEVVIVDPDGRERRQTARLAGHTLIWERQGTTLRLEGDFSRERAIAIARSSA